MKKLLFITWDGDQTNYLENLFFPILKGLQDSNGFACHVIQFSWAGGEEVERLKNLAFSLDLKYRHHKVFRKPIAALGAVGTVLNGSRLVKQYVSQNGIEIIMPRSTMPAWMVGWILPWLKDNGVKLVFDADGLPLEERMDFAGLSPNGLQYRFLKGKERTMLIKADAVLTRSANATKILQQEISTSLNGHYTPSKFHVVPNGRKVEQFKFDDQARTSIRRDLGLRPESKLFVYTGSLGLQYALEEMFSIFGTFHQNHPDALFLLLSRQADYLEGKIPPALGDRIRAMAVDFSRVPAYLSAADVAFSLRQPTFSTQAVFPIKLGEYLLTGLPTLASKGIGDTEKLLEGVALGRLYDHDDPDRVSKAVSWMEGMGEVDRGQRQEIVEKRFGLEETVRVYGEVLGRL